VRREDRLASVLHPEKGDTVLRATTIDGPVAAINDGDICLHCRRHQCVAVCPTVALTTRDDGRIAVHDARCITCGACVVACYEFHNVAWRARTAVAG
jgi:Fe-S-cluster-containing dehydrogenase component